MIEREIIIRLADETSDSRFSTGVDVAENAVQTATTTKTNVATSKKSVTKQVASGVGMNIANTATGGMVSKYTGVFTMATNPVAIALMALTVANAAYAAWRERQRNELENQAILLRAGGSHQRVGNLYNARTNFITGKYRGQETRHGGR